MHSYQVVNLLIPGDPENLSLALTTRTWELERAKNFDNIKLAIERGKCGHTYFLENSTSLDDGAAAFDEAFEEVTPLLLGASYAMGMTVTIERSTQHCDAKIIRPSDHWPRARTMNAAPIVRSDIEFGELVARFVSSWPLAGKSEKALLLVHHWLDSLSCWSMEDLYLSATTLLQIIVATETRRQGVQKLRFRDGVNDAATHFGLRQLSDDFRDMRNDLIHEGKLIGSKFLGPDHEACAVVVADVLNWFDEYLHAALALGAPRVTRFASREFAGLNAYSI